MPDNKTSQKPNAIQKARSKRYLKMYVAPIVAIVVFLGIILGLVVPKISSIFSTLDIISQDSIKLDESYNTLNKLKSLTENSALIHAQLKVVDGTTPTGTTEVVKFRDKVTLMTQSHDLRIINQRLSESILNPGKDKENNQPGNFILQEVPFIFEIAGPYEEVINFIEELSTLDDFIIVREMELKGSGGEAGASIWTLKIRIDKYQFKIVDETLTNQVFDSVPLDAEVSKQVLDYVNRRIDQ